MWSTQLESLLMVGSLIDCRQKTEPYRTSDTVLPKPIFEETLINLTCFNSAKFLNQERQYFHNVTDDTVIGRIEYRRIRILVDSDDNIR